MGLGLLLTVLSVAGTDWVPNRLLGALQFWRFLLFVTLFGNLLAAPVMFGAAPSTPERFAHSRGLIVWAVGLAIVESVVRMVGIGSALVAAAALLSFAQEASRAPVPRRPVRIAASGLAALGVLATATTLAVGLWQDIFDVAPLAAAMRLATILAVGGVVLRSGDLTRARPIVVGLLSAAMLLSLTVVDERSPMRRFVESGAALDPAAEEMMRGRTVYWEGNLPMQWFKLRMPGYYSCRQKGGINFFRDQAFEFQRRAQVLSVLNTTDFEPEPVGRCPETEDAPGTGPRSERQIAQACRQAPELDVLVLERSVGDRARLTLAIPGTGEDGGTDRVYNLYECSDFRQ